MQVELLIAALCLRSLSCIVKTVQGPDSLGAHGAKHPPHTHTHSQKHTTHTCGSLRPPPARSTCRIGRAPPAHPPWPPESWGPWCPASGCPPRGAGSAPHPCPSRLRTRACASVVVCVWGGGVRGCAAARHEAQVALLIHTCPARVAPPAQQRQRTSCVSLAARSVMGVVGQHAPAPCPQPHAPCCCAVCVIPPRASRSTRGASWGCWPACAPRQRAAPRSCP